MNPFHFITHQAAQNLDASLVGKGIAGGPLRRSVQNRKIRRVWITSSMVLATVVSLSGLLR